jgi:hypothetical protein
MAKKRRMDLPSLKSGDRDLWVKVAVLIFLAASILAMLYLISMLSTASSLVILAIILISTAMALWYNYIAGRSPGSPV